MAFHLWPSHCYNGLNFSIAYLQLVMCTSVSMTFVKLLHIKYMRTYKM